MSDIFEIMDDLRELRSLYLMGELTEHDFGEKIAKYDSVIDRFEQEFAHEAQA